LFQTLTTSQDAGTAVARSKLDAARSAPWLLAVLTIVGGVLRVWQIGQKGLWLDEAFSVWLGWQPVPQMWGWLLKIDQHPPLYYTLLHFWMVFGDSASAVRLFSALAGTLTIPVIFCWGRRLGGVKVGLLAAFILALSPFHVRFAQETRMYTLLTLNASVALLALTYLLTDERSSAMPIGHQLADYVRAWPTRRQPLHAVQADIAWIVYIVWQTATALTHNTALLFPVAVNLFVGGLIVWRKASLGARHGETVPTPSNLYAPSVSNWLLAQLASLLLWSPWLVPFVIQARGVYEAFWIAPPTWMTVLGTVGTFFSDLLPASGGWLIAVIAGFLILVVMGGVALRKRPAALAMLLVLLVTPFVGELVVSLWRPIFYDRTLIWASLPLYLLLAFGVAQLHYRPYVLAGLALIVAANGMSLREYYVHYEKEQWQEAAAYVGQNVQTGDMILFNASWVQIPFDFYYRRANRPVPEHGAPVDLFDGGTLEPQMARSDLPRLHNIIQGYHRVWLIYSHNWYTDPQNLIPAALGEDLQVLGQRRFNGLEVRLYSAP
jgi:mannosyltransferase